MGALWEKAVAGARFAGEVLAETLWPTRCAACDAPGQVLCARCEADLPYLDAWRACPRCGAPYGLVQCTACNPVSLARAGRDAFPFAGCASAVLFQDGTSGRVVRAFKDHDEQRLAGAMARIMLRCLPPSWPVGAVTFVPATQEAMRRRGYDHAELLARQVAARLQVPCLALLARPRTRDQRRLGRAQRLGNTAGRFTADLAATSQIAALGTAACGCAGAAACGVPGTVACGCAGAAACGVPGTAACPDSGEAASEATCSLLLVDDVLTTGATLTDATDALLAAGAGEVRCLTFARVP